MRITIDLTPKLVVGWVVTLMVVVCLVWTHQTNPYRIFVSPDRRFLLTVSYYNLIVGDGMNVRPFLISLYDMWGGGTLDRCEISGWDDDDPVIWTETNVCIRTILDWPLPNTPKGVVKGSK